MTSSIYPILASLSTPIIDTPGSGYTSTPTVTIDAPLPGGTSASGTAVISDGVINGITLGGTLTGYTDNEEITLSAGSGTGAAATAVISAGTITSISFTNRGSDYTAADVIIITGVTSTVITGTITVNSIADDAVSSITITNGGTRYASLPTITITGGAGSGATATAVFNIKSTPILADTNILNSDIEIIPYFVYPGGGGILRLYFSFTGATMIVSVFNNDVFKGFLNADNNNDINNNGYYRFDIDVESGDNINLQSSAEISVNYIRAHLVQFGA